jgi:hypothetical protein
VGLDGGVIFRFQLLPERIKLQLFLDDKIFQRTNFCIALSQGLRVTRRGFGYAFYLRRSLRNGCCYYWCSRLQQLIVNDEEPVGRHPVGRLIKALRPLGSARSKSEDTVEQARGIWHLSTTGFSRVGPGRCISILRKCHIQRSAIGVKGAGGGFCDR